MQGNSSSLAPFTPFSVSWITSGLSSIQRPASHHQPTAVSKFWRLRISACPSRALVCIVQGETMNKSQSNNIPAVCKPGLLVCVWRSTGVDEKPLVCDWVAAGSTAKGMDMDKHDRDRAGGYYGSSARGNLTVIWIYHPPLVYARKTHMFKIDNDKTETRLPDQKDSWPGRFHRAIVDHLRRLCRRTDVAG